MSELEKLAKQRTPLLYFVPVRWLLGITWIYFFIKYTILTPTPSLLGWTVFALISGILLLLGLFTGLGAFMSLLLNYAAFFLGPPSGIATVLVNVGGLRVSTALSLLLVSVALLSWKTGRVLGLDKYVVQKVPFLAKILIV